MQWRRNEKLQASRNSNDGSGDLWSVSFQSNAFQSYSYFLNLFSLVQSCFQIQRYAIQTLHLFFLIFSSFISIILCGELMPLPIYSDSTNFLQVIWTWNESCNERIFLLFSTYLDFSFIFWGTYRFVEFYLIINVYGI